MSHLYSYYYLTKSTPELKIKINNEIQSLDLVLNIDVTRLKQLVTNLMDNACKFTKVGHIELGAQIVKDSLNIYVKDTGKGIPKSEINNIFQQFTKVEEDGSTWTQGIGLGLNISQKIARAMNAKIDVKSIEGRGSVFTFSVPLAQVICKSNSVTKMPKQSLAIDKNWQEKIVLIAEDVETNFLYLEKLLLKTQLKLIWAKNGKEAIDEALSDKRIDLILMDIKMPNINGYDAAKEIKKHKPQLPIVAQTAYSRPEERAKFYNENFDDYIPKPINPTELSLILEKYI